MMEPKWLSLRIVAVTVLLLLEGCRWCCSDACYEPERVALLQLKPFFNHLNYLNSWGEMEGSSNCCEWERVECNTSTKRVIGLSLNFTNWRGDLDWDVGLKIKDFWYLNASLFLPFEELKSLYLPGTQIAGFVENEELSSALGNLEILDLTYNYLNDSIILSLSDLSSLKYLSLAGNLFTGSSHANGFQWLSRLSKLETLDLSRNSLENSILFHTGGLSSLKTLNLEGNNLKGTVHIQEFNNLINLKILDLSENQIESLQSFKELHVSSNVEKIFLDGCSHLNTNILQSIGVLTSLKTLSLSECGLIGSLPDQGWCDLRNLEELDVSWNALEGILPYCLGNMTSLQVLDMSNNQFTGNLTHLANLTSLRFLSLSKNRFQISMSFIPLAYLPDLKILLGDENKMVMEPSFHTPIPKFQLKMLSLSKCTTYQKLSLEPFKFLYHQYDLRYVDLSYSNFSGTIPFWLLENNTKLEDLFLMGNYFTGPLLLPSVLNLNLSSIDMSNNKLEGQIPSNICSAFPHLERLFLSKNAFEGNIPPCLSGMSHLLFLDLSNNKLSGRVPEELIMRSSLEILRLSNNNLSGKMVPLIFNSNRLSELYLDGNNFDGEIPDIDISAAGLPYLLEDIDLSNNNLNGKLPRWMGNVSYLKRLALSNNRFEGSIPMEFCNLYALEFLDLSQNNLSGSIPSCFNPPSIKHVHLNRNRLSDPLTLAFYNSSSLVTLDLRGNNLTGNIPEWIGTLSALSVLVLKGNHLHGGIPIQLCKLYSLSIIDLSQNMFSGSIPSCLGNLTLATTDDKSFMVPGWYGVSPNEDLSADIGMIGIRHVLSHEYPDTYMEEWIEYSTKSGTYSYGGDILNYMTGIDLSCNKLTGQIPFELGNLSGLYSLNLSHNSLIGVIPSSFSKLKQIESLDLSYNNLSGRIPIQLVELNTLEVFSVAHNNLSGSTPERKAQFGTFDENSYEGNPLLCGPPLHNNCSKIDSPSLVPTTSDDEGEGSFLDTYVFCVTFLVSYVAVLLAIFAVLYINPYWRQAWFSFIEGCIATCRYSIVGNFLGLYIFKRYA